MSNRLERETSPYLLQHKDNPVDWYPWGKEALDRAKKEDKPILLSIGYSACHWCHVMEKECFEDPAIAQLMNQNFVSIKVDREERPDLDQIYQNVAQAITQGGGWPLTVFLTPDLKPFFGGTYFPPDDRYGRPGFPRVLSALAQAFRDERSSIEENATKLTDWIGAIEFRGVLSMPFAARPPSSGDLQRVVEAILKKVDRENGGFGMAPKFPNTMLLSFMWRHVTTQVSPMAKDIRETVIRTLRKMAMGGIYDQLGGGFHRYSVDAEWRVPHFEKMLYDNALLLKLYAEVLLTGAEWLEPADENLFLRVLIDTKNYVIREMVHPEGGFYSSQDADSEGAEGKFFLWGYDELAKILPPEEFQVFTQRYGVTLAGNFENGSNILSVHSGIPEICKNLGITPELAESRLDSARNKLLGVRSQRPRPALDYKILVSWSGLMMSGLVWAGQVFKLRELEPQAQEVFAVVKRAFEWTEKNLCDSTGRLSGTYQGDIKKGLGFLDDYAYMAQAAVDLSRFSENSEDAQRYLKSADRWLEWIFSHFQDQSGGPGFYFTSDEHETLIHRPKSLFDQAIPSGSAIALGGMLVLSEMGFTSKADSYRKAVEQYLALVFQTMVENPYGFGESLCLGQLVSNGVITVSGPKVNELCWHPHVFQKPGGGAQYLQVCHRQTCSTPLQEASDAAAKIRELLYSYISQ